MSRQLLELEAVLTQLIGEHRKMLLHMERQQAAMQKMDARAIQDIASLQEATRLRITGLDLKRRQLSQQLCKLYKTEGELNMTRLADMFPHRRDALLKIRAELREVLFSLKERTTIVGKLTGAMLGHLNTVVRLLAGAVERAGVYNKHGVPSVSRRIGSMEAVG